MKSQYNRCTKHEVDYIQMFVIQPTFIDIYGVDKIIKMQTECLQPTCQLKQKENDLYEITLY